MSTAFVPARYFRTLLMLLQERHCDSADLLQAAQLPADFLLQQQDDFLTLLQVEAIVKRAVELTGNLSLGMLLGQRLNLSAHGVAGYAGLCAPTLGDALRVAQRFQPLVMPLTNLQVDEQPDQCHLRIGMAHELAEPARKLVLDATVSSIYIQGRFLYPEPWQEVTAYLPYAKEHYEAEALSAFENVDIHFSSEQLSLSIPPPLLGYPLALANEHSFAHAVRQCESMLQTLPRPGGMGEQLRQQLLLAGPPLPSLQELAQQRHVSERTLRRQLLHQGLRWRELVTDVKMTLAKQYLINGSDNITAIALRLGYQDSANFARAFKLYCGMTPSQWRH
jgi:AraC-like DNA-binding protein